MNFKAYHERFTANGKGHPIPTTHGILPGRIQVEDIMKTGLKNARLAPVAIGMLALGLAIASAITPAQSGPAQQAKSAQAAPASKTAGETFKNIQVLKDIPAGQLIPTMHFISTSLGVRCGYCHVEGAFWKDDKRPKLTARHMIQMEFAINKVNFGGHTEVTCYTCHRGLTHPVGVPVIAKEAASNASGGAMSSESMNHAAMPTADQILEKFVQASGGADAIQKISTRVEKGDASGPGGQKLPVEVFSKAPDEERFVMHMRGGESVRVYDGQEGWLANMGQPAHEITGAELDAMKLDADLHLPVNLKQQFPRLRVIHPETIDGREAYVLLGFNPNHPPVKFYFDSQSGLLVRVERFTATPLGYNPTQVDFADYRDTDGVKVPFRQTIAQPGRSFMIQFDQVQQNVPVSDNEFTKPAGAAAAGQKSVSP
ncbi:MAG: c-type cytochrome [Terriglobia bacterium]